MLSKFSGLLVSIACLLAFAPPVFAERLENGARFGEWTLVCEAIAVNETACVLNQRIVRADGAFLVDFLAIPEGDGGWLSARVPVGVHFPSGFVLRPEAEEQQIILVWQACSPELCEAMVSLSDEGATLLEGGPAIAAYRPGVTDEPVVFRVTLEGLSEGLAALAASGASVPGGAASNISE